MINHMRKILLGLALSVAALCQDPVPVSPYQLLTTDANSGLLIPCAGCTITTYTAGTNTPLPAYTNSALNVALSNPICTNAAGYATANCSSSVPTGIWIGTACYKLVAKDANAVTLWTQDNLCDQSQILKVLLAGANGASLVGFRPTSGDTIITVAAALNSYLIDTGYSTWATACAAAVSASKTLIVTKTWTGVVSAPCAMWFVSGGILRIAASTAAPVSGSITAPAWQRIFDTTTNASASVLLPTPRQDVWVNWFGADTTGGNDSQPAFAAAIAAIANGAAQPYGVTLRATAGTFLLDSTVTFTSSNMLIFHGAGADTQFAWGGNNSTPAIMLQDCTQCEIGGFQIVGNVTSHLLYGIQMQNSGSGTRWTATRDRLVDITIEGVAGYITTGVYMGGGTDGNNDQQYFESVGVHNYSHSAFTINHSQVYDVQLIHCVFAANGFGAIGVENLSGNFFWSGGTGAGNTSEDFYIGGINAGTYVIEKGRFENSAQFLVTGGPSYNPLSLALRSVNYAGNCLGATAMQIQTSTCPNPATGGAAIDYRFGGTLTMDNCLFGTYPATPLEILLQGFGTPTTPNFAEIRGSTFFSSLTTVATMFSGAKPTAVSSSWVFDNGTSTGIELFLNAAVAPVTLAASATIDVTGYPKGQIFLTPGSGTPSYDTITGMYDGYTFFVACRKFGAGDCTFTANTHNIQFAASLSPLTVSYENTVQFVCFSSVCSLVTAQ